VGRRFWFAFVIFFIIGFMVMAILDFMSQVANSHQTDGAHVDISRIIMAESSGNPSAVSEKGAVGLYQVSQPVLDDWNREYPSMYFTLKDMYNPEKCRIVASWYMNVKIPDYIKSETYLLDSNVNRLIAYHAGIGNLRSGKIGLETIIYVLNYFKEGSNATEKSAVD